MTTDNSKITLMDPELPASLRDAKRNQGGMTVPEDFFAQFERKMNLVIDAEVLAKQATEGPVLKPQTQPAARVIRPKRWIAIAASVIVVVALGIGWQFMGQETQVNAHHVDGLATINRESLQQQLENIELPDQMADEVMASMSDYEIYDLYCDL